MSDSGMLHHPKAEDLQRIWEAKQSQTAFVSELVQRIDELSQRTTQLEGENSELREKLQNILNAEIEKATKDSARAYRDNQAKLFDNYMHGEGCKCAACNPQMVGMVMILCPKCGNKRCPHATDHTYECTNSNEPGQVGSSY